MRQRAFPLLFRTVYVLFNSRLRVAMINRFTAQPFSMGYPRMAASVASSVPAFSRQPTYSATR